MLAMIIFMATSILLSTGTARAEYKEVTVENGGSISGKVAFKGELPEDAVEHFPVSGKWPGCGTGVRDVVRIDVADGALRGVFVLLDGITEGKPWSDAEPATVLDQKNCVFLPELQIVRAGTRLIVRNSDPEVLHNVNIRELIETSSGRTIEGILFNIAQPLPGDIKMKVKPKSSPYLNVGCELHNFMVAYILAPEHPYAVVVEPDGTFLLNDVPPGDYSLIAWHPKLGKKRTSVTVTAGGELKVDFEFGN
ncbi:MAG: hypothetical protein AMK71_07955 [Nitrospira bacterium SG8_35_4]|nr:MAG: hypothetical protein AMK71_07955 [Nitrospira bacterium SG8_35_4]